MYIDIHGHLDNLAAQIHLVFIAGCLLIRKSQRARAISNSLQRRGGFTRGMLPFLK